MLLLGDLHQFFRFELVGNVPPDLIEYTGLLLSLAVKSVSVFDSSCGQALVTDRIEQLPRCITPHAVVEKSTESTHQNPVLQVPVELFC